VDIDVVPGQIDNYLAALKENAAASVHEPGCHEFNIAVSQKDANHVFIFEASDNAAAMDAHRQTDHFKKYATTTKDMIAKRDPTRSRWSPRTLRACDRSTRFVEFGGDASPSSTFSRPTHASGCVAAAEINGPSAEVQNVRFRVRPDSPGN
jgi:(4S)-4-hydroxy-5-phosphonooxypentane-2,3-dione isomerase